jgi:hypothetical protein
MSTMSVAHAEQALVTSRAAANKQKREEAAAEVKRLSAEGSVMRLELEQIIPTVMQAERDRLALHAQLHNAMKQIAYYSAPLDLSKFPSKKNHADHAEQLVVWKKKQKELLVQHADAVRRESGRLRGIELQSELVRLSHSIANWTAIAEGRMPGEIVGGRYTVGEDFLGHTDRRFS